MNAPSKRGTRTMAIKAETQKSSKSSSCYEGHLITKYWSTRCLKAPLSLTTNNRWTVREGRGHEELQLYSRSSESPRPVMRNKNPQSTNVHRSIKSLSSITTKDNQWERDEDNLLKSYKQEFIKSSSFIMRRQCVLKYKCTPANKAPLNAH